jgi:cytochrome c oxidase assembly protein subunit 15
MPQIPNNSWLHRFALLTALATFLLLGAGGLVTSHGVGMAVPDWPNTYGYNPFFFPFSKWVGGIFYEHTHRLLASVVGMLTGILALWLHGRAARPFMRWTGAALLILGIANELLLPKRWADGVVSGATGLVMLGSSFFWPRCEPAAKWLRRLGWIAFVAVVLQGVLGGLRVVLSDDALGIYHATLAQLFFALTCSIALFTGKYWQKSFSLEPQSEEDLLNPKTGGASVLASRPAGEKVRLARTLAPPLNLRHWLVGTTALILFQLVLGATMRHQHAGLAIPDFPLAYGRLWPATDPESVARYNERRVEVVAANPITAFQIDLQMAHRIVAALIVGGVGLCAWRVKRIRGLLGAIVFAWIGLVLVQAALGAATVWSNKAADIATAHVLVGALSLVTGVLSCIVCFRSPEFARDTIVLSPVTTGVPDDHSIAAGPAAAQAQS